METCTSLNVLAEVHDRDRGGREDPLKLQSTLDVEDRPGQDVVVTTPADRDVSGFGSALAPRRGEPTLATTNAASISGEAGHTVCLTYPRCSISADTNPTLLSIRALLLLELQY
jgi:hypothetical protein